MGISNIAHTLFNLSKGITRQIIVFSSSSTTTSSSSASSNSLTILNLLNDINCFLSFYCRLTFLVLGFTFTKLYHFLFHLFIAYINAKHYYTFYQYNFIDCIKFVIYGNRSIYFCLKKIIFLFLFIFLPFFFLCSQSYLFINQINYNCVNMYIKTPQLLLNYNLLNALNTDYYNSCLQFKF